jgi:hypothetical protein
MTYGRSLALFRLSLNSKPVVAFLDTEPAKIGRMLGRIERAIELLREHRTALITAVVTGNRDAELGAGIRAAVDEGRDVQETEQVHRRGRTKSKPKANHNL